MAPPDAGSISPINVPGYQILEPLGSSKLGNTYVGQQISLHRPVIIKTIHPNITRTDGVLEALVHELSAAAPVMHPSLAVILDCGIHGRTFYYVREYLEGESLAKAISSGEPVEESEVIELAIPLCKALVKLDGYGLVHGNIKPENVIFCSDGRIVLTDFGLIRPLVSRTALKSGRGDGTPQPMEERLLFVADPLYMPPEWPNESAFRDIRTDIYNVGLLLFCLLTGAHPFHGQPRDILRMQMEVPVPALRDSTPRAGEAIAHLLARMTSKRLDDRIGSADELLTAIQQIAGHSDDFAAQHSASPTSPEPVAIAPAVQAVNPGFQETASGLQLPLGLLGAQFQSQSPVVMEQADGNASPDALDETMTDLPGISDENVNAEIAHQQPQHPPKLPLIVPPQTPALTTTRLSGTPWTKSATSRTADPRLSGRMAKSKPPTPGVPVASPSRDDREEEISHTNGIEATDDEMVEDSAAPPPQRADGPRLSPRDRVTIEILDGELKGRSEKLSEGSKIVIGRRQTCNLVLDDKRASNLHCTIIRRDGRIAVIDNGSHNGTRVNGRDIQQAELFHNDLIRIGRTRLRICVARS
ncbi:MAG TPA: FHA domain-containing serine/threonine-protein kinase [Candidatus Brocadiia bacterium]|nr:FHA domain-containing serine/threonine-protein kinase [Candidatus Brocadiia bacterium]